MEVSSKLSVTSNSKDSNKLQVASNELKDKKESEGSSFSEGYTLLELLISITLIAVILLIVGGAMRLGFRSVDSGEKKIDSLERYKASLDILDSQLQSAFSMKEGGPGTLEKKYSFRGDRESMEFPTNRSIWGEQKGYVVVAYTVEADCCGKKSLGISEGFIGVERRADAKLLTSVDSIYFEYFSKDPFEEKGKWVDQWTDQGSVPKMVRITLVDKYGKLALIVPVRIGNSPADQAVKAKDL